MSPSTKHELDLHNFGMMSLFDGCGAPMLPQPFSGNAGNSNWSLRAAQSRKSSEPSPNIFSADYDPFAPRHSNMTSAHKPSQYTPSSLAPASPSLSCLESSRSSFSSVNTSEHCSSHIDPYYPFPPRIKMEDQTGWPSEPRSAMTMTESEERTVLPTPTPPYQAFAFEPYPFEQQGALDWPKTNTRGGNPLSGGTQIAAMNVVEPRQGPEQLRVIPSATRKRTTRKMTTREDANFQCRVRGCGKLFSRSYNFKAHMETHDSGRVYPFPCPVVDCGKKFVRKTDLQRHHQSVHMKERNFQCEYCCRFFARKDTLRRQVLPLHYNDVELTRFRHMEDGCSKRFDLDVAFSSPEQQNTSEGPVPPGMSLQPPYMPHNTTYPVAPCESAMPFQQLEFGARTGYDTSDCQGSIISSNDWQARR
ncbi:MAG: hypothetical protein M1818_001887 [Claussenomyces sp. TS43310]|nr:MAG: hypothetical protein M1818_001887 [Claussenomyces sp. TS43310]